MDREGRLSEGWLEDGPLLMPHVGRARMAAVLGTTGGEQAQLSPSSLSPGTCVTLCVPDLQDWPGPCPGVGAVPAASGGGGSSSPTPQPSTGRAQQPPGPPELFQAHGEGARRARRGAGTSEVGLPGGILPRLGRVSCLSSFYCISRSGVGAQSPHHQRPTTSARSPHQICTSWVPLYCGNTL